MDKERLKEQIVYYFKKQYQLGMLNTFEGNLSTLYKNGDDVSVLITPSQQDKEKISSDMILEVDLDGDLLAESAYKPTSEMVMHLALYKLRPDIGCVLHNHSPYATAFALAGEPIENDMAESYMFYGGSIPVCTYGRPGSDDVFSDFEKYFVYEDKDVVLLANHGLVSCGKDISDAFSKAEAVEKLAKISILTKVVGPEKELPEDEKEALIEFYKSHR